MKAPSFWTALQSAEAKVVARVRSLVFLIAGGGFAFANTIDDPAWIKHAGNIAFAVCGALALLLRAGDKTTPENVLAAQNQLQSAPAPPPPSQV